MVVNGKLKMTRKDVIVDYLKYFHSNIGDTEENYNNWYPGRPRFEPKTPLKRSRIATLGPTWNYFSDSQPGLHKGNAAGP
jgi:hypothetical protein